MSYAMDRHQTMRQLAAVAREYDRRHDVVLRRQAATEWRALATAAEAARAPRYLTWAGRRLA
mgnify:CR=1 FL=1